VFRRVPRDLLSVMPSLSSLLSPTRTQVWITTYILSTDPHSSLLSQTIPNILILLRTTERTYSCGPGTFLPTNHKDQFLIFLLSCLHAQVKRGMESVSISIGVRRRAVHRAAVGGKTPMGTQRLGDSRGESHSRRAPTLPSPGKSQTRFCSL
jgi:hypothetical protein